MEEVVLVDEQDNAIGKNEKLEAHRLGQLHRAFSIFIFNSQGEMLLQQRTLTKYHSGGLWTNACCSHPRPDETTIDAAHRRLNEELGMATELKFLFNFKYKAEFENGLIEHELDHVFVGQTDFHPVLNRDEAMAYKYVKVDDLKKDIKQRPEAYTFWFKEIIDQVIKEYQNELDN